jgi:hypothetical protein
MSSRDKPALEELQRDLLHRTGELHRALIAPDGRIEARQPSTPERAALAVDNGLQKLRRAAYHARAAKVAASAPVSRELMRIADSIERNGLGVQVANLERGAAAAVEAETGEPVAQRVPPRRDRPDPGRASRWNAVARSPLPGLLDQSRKRGRC